MKKTFTLIITAALLSAAFAVAQNLDMVVRLFDAYQENRLTAQKIRYEFAAFNFGKKLPAPPEARKISPQDGMTQFYVPAGEFLMGRENAKGTSGPAHKVYLDAFWIDRVEVSNAMYLKCMAAGGCAALASDNTRYQNWIYRDHPVVYVTWEQAKIYCEWAGRSLPTEAQWEKAGRGTDGRLYPWGNEEPSPALANFAGTGIHEAVSVYRYPLGASPYGALNMAGNAREWVADWFDAEYYNNSPYQNPQGAQSGFERSLRSGSYNEDGREILITKRYNHEPGSAGLSRGFRCAENEAPR